MTLKKPSNPLAKLLKIPYLYLLAGPIAVWGMGFAMNAIVMAANNNQMPVYVPGGCPADGLGEAIHVCMTKASHFKILGDWIFIRSIPAMFSPGDVFETFCEVVWAPCLAAWAALMIKSHGKRTVAS